MDKQYLPMTDEYLIKMSAEQYKLWVEFNEQASKHLTIKDHIKQFFVRKTANTLTINSLES